MKVDQIVAELEALAKKLQVRVTYEALGGELGSGGLCKVKGEWRAIVDRRSTPSERASILGQALSRFPLPEGTQVSEPVLTLLGHRK